MAEHIITMKMELHLADYYGQDLILVSKLSTYTGNNKLFKLMTRLDVRAFTNSFRKTNVSVHKRIGSYNTAQILQIAYFPDMTG